LIKNGQKTSTQSCNIVKFRIIKLGPNLLVATTRGVCVQQRSIKNYCRHHFFTINHLPIIARTDTPASASSHQSEVKSSSIKAGRCFGAGVFAFKSTSVYNNIRLNNFNNYSSIVLLQDQKKSMHTNLNALSAHNNTVKKSVQLIYCLCRVNHQFVCASGALRRLDDVILKQEIDFGSFLD
jgi:hypothetical protein